MITSSKNMDIDNDRNMKFIDICVKNNEDEEILLLKRKKLYEENENILDWLNIIFFIKSIFIFEYWFY